MDLLIRIYLDRAENELILAKAISRISSEKAAKTYLDIDEPLTFYSSVISHSYYAIFYSAKAILLTKGVQTSSPDVHKKTFDAFKNDLVETGVLDANLLEIYRRIVVRADALLEIFRTEKRKRGNFTYNTIPQANKEPAEDSVANAKVFVSSIKNLIEKKARHDVT